MPRESPALRMGVLLALLLAYAVASLFHHVHNAEFLNQYPNLPAWLSRSQVYGAWLSVTSVGVLGYLLLRWQHRITGLIVLGVYGLLGLDGLAHYAIAPVTAHTLAMNLSIVLEVVTAILLLTAVASSLLGLWGKKHEAAQK